MITKATYGTIIWDGIELQDIGWGSYVSRSETVYRKSEDSIFYLLDHDGTLYNQEGKAWYEFWNNENQVNEMRPVLFEKHDLLGDLMSKYPGVY